MATSDAYTCREEAGSPMLLRTIGLYAQLGNVQEHLRKRINNLDKSVEERQALFKDLKAQEQRLIDEIVATLEKLSDEEHKWVLDRYEPE